ncbi:hypothetical protein SUGI_0846320 [Cryptomeria japonica]|nr:hypothetical protein SUGI_0846320 [Cryptomeria japonica]
MGRKNKWESLIKLDVQDISNEGNNFSSEDLEWTQIGDDNNRHIDLCAAIPFERLSHFVQGEGLLDETETQFVIKKHKVYNLTEPNDHATKMYLSYHCAYGPEDRRNKPENNLEKMQRIRRFTQKRGCQAHFYVKVMYGRPNVAIITYNEFSHQDANGEFCHGKDDPSGDPRSSVAPRLSNECKSYIESLLLMGVSIDTICEQHYLDRGLTKLMNKRDTCLLRKDVLNAWKRVRSLRSQKNEDDAKSVCLWHEEEKDNFFYYKTPNNEENVPFIIGIQTPWMREMMVKHSHNSIIAMDSTFSTNKYGVSRTILIVFVDLNLAGVPVAWAISSRNKVEDINEWLMEVYKRGKQDKEDWHVNAFMTDDASAEIEAIRLSFDCQVLLCIWHVRRAWLKNVYRYVSNKDVATHIFDRLGEIMYEISDDQGITTQSIKNFMEEFKEEKKFIDYFQNTWCHDESRIAMWAKHFRNFSHANQETNASIESYHSHIKSHYLSDRSKKCTRRMDWLIHTLLHRVEPFYKNKRYLQLSGFLTNFKKERYYITALERSKNIADVDCFLYDLLPNTYRIRSQTIPTKWYFVRKFEPNLHVCDCDWAKRGNTCKHVLKVLDILKRNKPNEQDQVVDDVTPLVDDIDEVRGNSSHEIDIIGDSVPTVFHKPLARRREHFSMAVPVQSISHSDETSI